MGLLQERRRRFAAIDVYPVLTRAFCAGRPLVDVCRQVVAGGAKVLQLREKDCGKREFLALAREARRLTAEAGVLLIVNDQIDIALAVDADGVHLGQEDLPLAEARGLGPELLLGASTHGLEEALAAETQGADYINIGPIFSTQTKSLAMKALGPNAIPAISRRVRVPFTVMGGIHAGNLDLVLQTGARRIAMVTEITQAPDVAQRIRDLRKRINTY